MRLKYIILIVLTLVLTIPRASALLTIKDISESFSFNWVILFLVIFFACWIVLKDVFKSSQGAAIIISVVLAIGGSIGFLYKYGLIVPRLDLFVLLIIIGLIIFIIRSIAKKGQDNVVNILLFAIPVIWFIFIRDKVTFLINPMVLNVLNGVFAIILVIGIILLVLSLIKPKEKNSFFR